MYEYEIKYEPVEIDGKIYPKYNVYYYTNNELESVEFYATDLNFPQTIIRYGYKLKK
jgi:hypothetical protein